MQLAWIAGVVALGLLFVYAAITFVHRDAPRHDMDPDQWTGIVALTGGIGFLVYLALRGSADDTEPDDEFTLPGED